jgi:DNA polymerase III epsilon subunit-like protein
MTRISKKTLYCSLDIETSDFDPATGEILELGMVFFEVEEKQLKVLSEWQSTFKPSKPVPPRILALTGITEEELVDAPQLKDKHKEIQELVKDCVIVGHNIVFDIKFMESFGIKFSGDKIDTLDLAQMFLPTNPSYNLEALMNLLEVSHKDAHRALADAKAAMIVVEKLLQFYSSYSEKLKAQLLKLFSVKDFPYINHLLSTNFENNIIVAKPKIIDTFTSKEISESIKDNNKVITFPLGFDYHNYVYGGLQKGREKVLLVVNNKTTVYQLWKQKLAYPIFDNKEVFDNEAFGKALKGDLTPEQRFFFAKILVWKFTNWQAEVLCDLNFSFFGNQYKYLINSASKKELVWPFDKTQKIVVVDYNDFINFELEKEFSERKIIILDLNSFEKALTEISSKKVSWNDFIYCLKQVYDPVTKNGKKALEEVVSEGLAQVDLFFGLASINWKKIDGSVSQLLVSEKIQKSQEFAKINSAAQSFVEKMTKINKKLDSDRIGDYLNYLSYFFVEDQNQIKWIEISEGRLLFALSPLSLENLAAKKLLPYKKMLFTASLGSESLIKYFTRRLNLQDFGIRNVGQQELRKKFTVIIPKEVYDSAKVLKLVQTVSAPAALLLPNSSGLKAFYEANFKLLGEKYKVAAQSYSGGTNKLLDNFSINDNALLLATDYFILKQNNRRLRVKELILTRIPFEQFNHPLFAAQAERYPNQFIDFNVPRALYNFHSIIRFFYSQDLEKIYILDQKIHKEYGKFFIDYLQSLPFVEIKFEVE